MENEYKYPTNGYQCYLQKISKKNGGVSVVKELTTQGHACSALTAEGLQMLHLEPFQNPPSVCKYCNFKQSTFFGF